MLNRGIGSNFSNKPIVGKDNGLFNDDTKWFISGRAALNFILKDILNKHPNVKTVALPSWCCDTMIHPIIKNGLDYIFYQVIYKDNKLVKDINVKADVLINLDYFGFESDDNINFDGIIINDVTHSIFNKHNKIYDYTYGSLRKWDGFITGGFCMGKDDFSITEGNVVNEEYDLLKNDAMHQKNEYLSSKSNSQQYLELFNKTEDMLENNYDYVSSNTDIDEAKHFDVEFIKNKRQENAKVLIERLNKYCMFKEVKNDDCPLFVPILVNNRDALRKALIGKNIYCPIHWPISDLHKLNADEKYIYDHELSLICDQRYNIDDMNYICDVIEEFGC